MKKILLDIFYGFMMAAILCLVLIFAGESGVFIYNNF